MITVRRKYEGTVKERTMSWAMRNCRLNLSGRNESRRKRVLNWMTGRKGRNSISTSMYAVSEITSLVRFGDLSAVIVKRIIF
jgi:hypothetical protein